MTLRGCDVPMDSYRLAQYSAQVGCYICEGANTFDAELCRHCFAPMALASLSRASSSAASAARPQRCKLEGLPNTSDENGAIAARTSSRIGVVAA